MTNPTVTLDECFADILKIYKDHDGILDMYITWPLIMVYFCDGERKIYYIK